MRRARAWVALSVAWAVLAGVAWIFLQKIGMRPAGLWGWGILVLAGPPVVIAVIYVRIACEEDLEDWVRRGRYPGRRRAAVNAGVLGFGLAIALAVFWLRRFL